MTKKNKAKSKPKKRTISESVADDNDNVISTITKWGIEWALEHLDLEPDEVSEPNLRKRIRHVQGNHRTHRGNHRSNMKTTIEACSILLNALSHGLMTPDVENTREEEVLNVNALKRKLRKQCRNAAEREARRMQWQHQRDQREHQFRKEEQRERKLERMLESAEQRIVRVERHRSKVAQQKECERDILCRRHYERISKCLERLKANKQRHRAAIERLERRLVDSEDESSYSDDCDSVVDDDALSFTDSDIAFFKTLEHFKIVVYDDEKYDSCGDDDDDDKTMPIKRRFPGGLKERDNMERYKEVPEDYNGLDSILSYEMDQVHFTGRFRAIYDRLQRPVESSSFAQVCDKFRAKAFVDWHFELKDAQHIAMAEARLAMSWWKDTMVVLRLDYPPGYRADERMAPPAIASLQLVGNASPRIIGIVEEVNHERKCIYVSMNRNFAIVNKHDLRENNKFDVYINNSMFNCTSILRAIDYAHTKDYRDTLFPRFPADGSPLHQRWNSEIRSLNYEDSVPYNEMQKTAIYEIARGDAAYPFVLFGPPGTGKTTVLVESVHQILYENPYARILICAPSGRAADVIAERILLHSIIDSKFIFRMNSQHSNVKERNHRLDRISFLSNLSATAVIDAGEVQPEGNFSHFSTGFKIPKLSQLKRYRVIVCTLAASSYLVSARMPRSHFSHIIVDEAGQCTEPETWIPITGLAGKDTRIVLSGDPKQLGPITNFRLADQLGCNKSMLERLCNMPAYKINQQLMVMLTDCYRCHPAIIRLPSNMFYDGKLRAFTSGDFDQAYRRLANWSELPPNTKNFPLIFHDITRDIGWEEQGEMGSKSYCNMAELNKVCDYIRMILKDGIAQESEIGIVAPYKLQIERLRKELKPYPHIVVDSVERFQGSEKSVIIISTVRTEGLGFLKDKQRFNTAITRAKNLLIVVGNGDALWRGSQYWQKFIAYCEERGGFYKN